MTTLRYPYPVGNTKGDNPKLTGEPDSSLFNRGERHEVYYLVNKFCSKYSDVTDTKTERLIHEHLPGNIRTQVGVMEWLEANYFNY